MTDKCKKCGESEDEVELFTMPCCDNELCWDFCLNEQPKKCPICGERIIVGYEYPDTQEGEYTVVEGAELRDSCEIIDRLKKSEKKLKRLCENNEKVGTQIQLKIEIKVLKWILQER